ncbi:MAG: glycerol-3-phosphate 1-O-acyltransferase [Dehalococcoidia bacterium]|nr:glycerol-3-phosphate 1-O-acyltransferase [Dehalococcoidia bacterium]
MDYLLLAIASYLVGSIPSGFLFGKLARGVDMRRYGSGNIGAANALRTLGAQAFIAVFLADFVKGLLPVVIAGLIWGSPVAQVVAGLAAVAGHNWSVFLRGEGGRGVSTGIGSLFGMCWPVAAIVTAVTVSVMVMSRYISLGSVVGAAFALPAVSLAAILGFMNPIYLWYAIPAACAIIFQHRGNIQRLRAGTERRIGGPAILG